MSWANKVMNCQSMPMVTGIQVTNLPDINIYANDAYVVTKTSFGNNVQTDIKDQYNPHLLNEVSGRNEWGAWKMTRDTTAVYSVGGRYRWNVSGALPIDNVHKREPYTVVGGVYACKDFEECTTDDNDKTCNVM